MTKRFRHRYRIASARAEWWDYGWNGAYYVTICTKDRECIFGDVICDVPEPYVELSEIGMIAHQYWEEIPDHFPFVELGEFIVMPNHMHGIVIIDRPGNEPNARIGYVPPKIMYGPIMHYPIMQYPIIQYPIMQNPIMQNPTVHPDQNRNPNPNPNPDPNRNQNPNRHIPHSYSNAATDDNISSARQGPDIVNPDQNIRWKPGTLGVIINQYKRKCTIEARTIRKDFGWHSRFHDRIIRDEAEFQRISEYIRNNPSSWKKDRFNQG